MREASHDYVPVGRLLVSTRQRPTSLGRLLLVQGRPLIGVREGAGGATSRRAREVGRVARIAADYAGRRRDAATVAVPVAGEVALPVVAGHKVFHLTAGRVTTVLHPTTDEASMLAIVRQLRRAAACPLAPAVVGVDLPARTYVEEYVDGPRLRGLDPRLQRLPAYLPLLASVVSALPPRSVDVATYATMRANEIRARAVRLTEAIPGGRATEVRATIERFVDSMLARLMRYGDLPVQLMLSHGDLHGGNVCMTAAGPRIIDWGLSDVRTPSYDLYNRVFRTAWLRGQTTLPLPRVAAALAAFTAHLAAHRSVDVATWREAEEAHRLLFYLEDLSPKKPGAPSGDPTVTLRRQQQHIAGFRALEEQRAAG